MTNTSVIEPPSEAYSAKAIDDIVRGMNQAQKARRGKDDKSPSISMTVAQKNVGNNRVESTLSLYFSIGLIKKLPPKCFRNDKLHCEVFEDNYNVVVRFTDDTKAFKVTGAKPGGKVDTANAIIAKIRCTDFTNPMFRQLFKNRIIKFDYLNDSTLIINLAKL